MTQQTNPTAQTTSKVTKEEVNQCFLSIARYIEQEEVKAPKGELVQQTFDDMRMKLLDLKVEIDATTRANNLMSALNALGML